MAFGNGFEIAQEALGPIIVRLTGSDANTREDALNDTGYVYLAFSWLFDDFLNEYAPHVPVVHPSNRA